MTLVLTVTFAFVLSVTSCASVQKNSGFLSDNYKKLEPGPEGTLKMRWIKPGPISIVDETAGHLFR
jgi:hypothetical protein